MKIKHFYQLIFIGSVALGAVSCAQRPPVTAGLGAMSVNTNNEFHDKLKIDNPKLAKKISITDIASRKKNQVLQVNVEIVSTDKKSQNLQYQFTWFDQQGFVIESNKQAWKPLELHGGQLVKLQGVAPNELADTFNIYIREVNKKAYEF